MNLLSRVLLGALIIAVFGCLWYLLTQKNKGGSSCSGNCAGCATPCSEKDSDDNR